MLSLLPASAGPRFHASSKPAPAALRGLSGLVLLQSLAESPAATLPLAPLWRSLHARAKPRHGDIRVGTTGADDRCAVALAYCRPDSSSFERLALAGRALKALGGVREPRGRLGLLAGARSTALHRGLLDALCAAASSHGFPLPSARADARAVLARADVFDARDLDLRRVQATADAANLVRHLTALPGNMLDATTYRTVLTRLARRHKLRLRWLNEAALARAGAGAFLSVSRGSARRDAGIAHLSWRPRGHRGAADVALIGKGIVFDTGGTNLKPHRGMLDMHTDMAGSAVALATLIALAELKAPLAIDAWLAITDNAIGPRASRPQDIVRAANGTSIQLIHTDAEGRMVLADTLALAGATRPKLMVDFATLTGACVHALTERRSGVFSNRPRLLEALSAAGDASGERVWPFPLDEDYDSDIASTVADVAQCAVDGKGDHILAARFLQRFVPDGVPWAHVDLSSATRTGGLAHVPTDITGFGVRLTLALLLDSRGALS
jgi:leucyl aminopeptidase